MARSSGGTDPPLPPPCATDRPQEDSASNMLGMKLLHSLPSSVSAMLPSFLCLRALACTTAAHTSRAGIFRCASKLNASATVQQIHAVARRLSISVSKRGKASLDTLRVWEGPPDSGTTERWDNSELRLLRFSLDNCCVGSNFGRVNEPLGFGSVWRKCTGPLPWELGCNAVLLNPAQAVEQTEGTRDDIQLLQLLLQRQRRIVHSFNAQHVAVVLSALGSLRPKFLRLRNKCTWETLHRERMLGENWLSASSSGPVDNCDSVQDSTKAGSCGTEWEPDWRLQPRDSPKPNTTFVEAIKDNVALEQASLDANLHISTAELAEHGCSVISNANASTTAVALVAACTLRLQRTPFFEKSVAHLITLIRDSFKNSHKHRADCVPAPGRYESNCLPGARYSGANGASLECETQSHLGSPNMELIRNTRVTKHVFPYSIKGVCSVVAALLRCQFPESGHASIKNHCTSLKGQGLPRGTEFQQLPGENLTCTTLFEILEIAVGRMLPSVDFEDGSCALALVEEFFRCLPSETLSNFVQRSTWLIPLIDRLIGLLFTFHWPPGGNFARPKDIEGGNSNRVGFGLNTQRHKLLDMIRVVSALKGHFNILMDRNGECLTLEMFPYSMQYPKNDMSQLYAGLDCAERNLRNRPQGHIAAKWVSKVCSMGKSQYCLVVFDLASWGIRRRRRIYGGNAYAWSVLFMCLQQKHASKF